MGSPFRFNEVLSKTGILVSSLNSLKDYKILN